MGDPRTGVALIEAILVIIVLSLAATAGMIHFDSGFTGRRSVAIETKNLEESLRSVRNTAIMNKTIIRVRQVRTRTGYQLEILESAGPMRDGRQTFVSLQQDLQLTGTSGWVEFRPDGTLSRELRLSIAIRSVRGTLWVNPVNGDISTSLPTRS